MGSAGNIDVANGAVSQAYGVCVLRQLVALYRLTGSQTTLPLVKSFLVHTIAVARLLS